MKTVFTKDGVEVEKGTNKYKGHIFYDEDGGKYKCLGYFPKLDDCVYENLQTGKEVVGCMDGFYFKDPTEKYAKGSTIKGRGVKESDLLSLEGHWKSYNKGEMSGKQDEGYITIKNEKDLNDYIKIKIGDVVKDVNVIEKGKNYPYNRSNPYSEDTYLVTLKNGTTFEVERSYGSPNWSGNVNYKEQIKINNISVKYANGSINVGDIVTLKGAGNSRYKVLEKRRMTSSKLNAFMVESLDKGDDPIGKKSEYSENQLQKHTYANGGKTAEEIKKNKIKMETKKVLYEYKNHVDKYYKNDISYWKNDKKMTEMLKKDKSDHYSVMEYMKSGSWDGAYKEWIGMDTASREQITKDAYDLLNEKNGYNKYAKGSTINVGSKIMLKHKKGYSEIEARDWWDTASEKQRISFLEENGGYSDKYANYNWSSLSPAVKDEVIQVKGNKYAKGSTVKTLIQSMTAKIFDDKYAGTGEDWDSKTFKKYWSYSEEEAVDKLKKENKLPKDFKYSDGGGVDEQGINLFEDYKNIPKNVQKILDKYNEDFEEGNYKGLERALKDLKKIGYTFEYGLDGGAYDLRPIGTKGKSEFEQYANGGGVGENFLEIYARYRSLKNKGTTIKGNYIIEFASNGTISVIFGGEEAEIRVEKGDKINAYVDYVNKEEGYADISGFSLMDILQFREDESKNVRTLDVQDFGKYITNSSVSTFKNANAKNGVAMSIDLDLIYVFSPYAKGGSINGFNYTIGGL